MNSELETSLFHTEVRWLSKGNMLSWLYELRKEVKLFLINKENKELLDQFFQFKCQIHLAYLDFFAQLNKLQWSGNMKLEGTSNIFAFEERARENFSAFDTLNPIIDEQCADIKEEIQENITLHLQNFKNELNRYFPDCKDQDIRKLIRNPFIVNSTELPDEIQEELIEM